MTSLRKLARYAALPLGLLLALSAGFVVQPPARVEGSSMPFNVGTVLKSVVFLYYPKEIGFEVGTGFLVEIPSKADPKRTSVVLVTARHIVDPKWAGCSWANPFALHAMVNVKNFKYGQTRDAVDELQLDLAEGAKRTWYASTNERTDAAVLPLTERQVAQLLQNDVRFIPVSDFATSAETANYNVGIGDEIVTAGLVPALLDTKRNYPAFKFGRISNIPEEPINMVCEKGNKSLPRDVWLLAGNYVGGNSGSPVFLLPTLPAAHRVMLIGIIAGAIPDVDLGQMVPAEDVFAIIQAHFPNANLYRGRTAGTITKPTCCHE